MYNYNNTKVNKGKNHCSHCYSWKGSSSQGSVLHQRGRSVVTSGGQCIVTFDVEFTVAPWAQVTLLKNDTFPTNSFTVHLSSITTTGFVAQTRFIADGGAVADLSSGDIYWEARVI